MPEQLYFEPTSYTSTQPSFSLPNPTTKPNDDFSTSPLTPSTIFHLAIIQPHTDTYTLVGPESSFSALLPPIISIISNSPQAIDKLDALRTISHILGGSEPNVEFAERGFTTFVVDGQRGLYTVLKILREENRAVRNALPSPVHVVSRHGPLVAGEGYVRTTRLVGSCVGQGEARIMAERCLGDLLRGEGEVMKSEVWSREGGGSGMLMAMGAERSWEVRIRYEEQIHMRAKEDLERRGMEVGWRF